MPIETNSCYNCYLTLYMKDNINIAPSPHDKIHKHPAVLPDMFVSNSDDTSNKSVINEITQIDKILENSLLLEPINYKRVSMHYKCSTHSQIEAEFVVKKDQTGFCKKCAFIYEMQNSKRVYDELEEVQKYKFNLISAFMKTLIKYQQKFIDREKKLEHYEKQNITSKVSFKRAIETIEHETVKAVRDYFKRIKAKKGDGKTFQGYLEEINRNEIEKTTKEINKFMTDVQENFYKIIFNIELEPFKDIMEFYTTRIRNFDQLLQKEIPQDGMTFGLEFIKKDLQNVLSDKVETIVSGVINGLDAKKTDGACKTSYGNSTTHDLKSVKSNNGYNSYSTKVKDKKIDVKTNNVRANTKQAKNSPEMLRKEIPLKIQPKCMPDSPSYMKKKIIHNTSVSYPSAKKQEALIIPEEDHKDGRSSLYDEESCQNIQEKYVSIHKESLRSVEEEVGDCKKPNKHVKVSKAGSKSSFNKSNNDKGAFVEIDKDLLSQLPIIKEASARQGQLNLNNNAYIRPKRENSEYLNKTQNTQEEIGKTRRKASNTEIPANSKPEKAANKRYLDKASLSRDNMATNKDKKRIKTINRKVLSPKFSNVDRLLTSKGKRMTDNKAEKYYTHSDNKNNNLNQIIKNSSGQYFSTKDHRKSVLNLHKKLSGINSKEFIFKVGVRKQLNGNKMMFAKKNVE